MTATALHRAPDSTSNGPGELDHLFCCDPDTALCGADISDTVYGAGDGETTCVVCADLEATACPRCGFDPICPTCVTG